MNKELYKFIYTWATISDLFLLIYWNIFKIRKYKKFEISFKDGCHYWACMKLAKETK